MDIRQKNKSGIDVLISEIGVLLHGSLLRIIIGSSDACSPQLEIMIQLNAPPALCSSVIRKVDSPFRAPQS